LHILTEIEDEQEPDDHSIDKNADEDVGGAEEEHRNAVYELAAHWSSLAISRATGTYAAQK
jgi:hypothetical protein